MKHLIRLLVVLAFTGIAAIPAASAADRMWMGFHDDPVFRWDNIRMDELDKAQASHATIIRTLVTWANAAPVKPANATNPFDPAYKLDDVDELVRNAQVAGHGGADHDLGHAEVGERRQDAELPADEHERHAPVRAGARVPLLGTQRGLSLRPLLRHLERVEPRPVPVAAVRPGRLDHRPGGVREARSGSLRRHQGGEPEGARRDRRDVLARARQAARRQLGRGHAGQVRGARRKGEPEPEVRRLGAPSVPVPGLLQSPSQLLKWPNVSLKSFPRFETSLDTWFHRKNIPIWITEYGHETKPGEPLGVTEAQQAAYVPQAIALAKADPRVTMFIWFVFRDSQGSTWQSGLNELNGTPKPALARWTAVAPGLDARNPSLSVKGGSAAPTISLPVREICGNNAEGTPVGTTYRARVAGKLIKVGQVQVGLGSDCTRSRSSRCSRLRRGRSTT